MKPRQESPGPAHPSAKLDGKILLIALFCLAIRLIYVNQPLVDDQNWRQTDTAAIARNFYEEDFRLLYPRVDWRGTTEGYVECEFPLYPYLVALLYRVLGGVHEGLGRGVSAVFCALSVLILFKLTVKLYDRRTGYWAGLLFGIMPINVFFGRAFMVESMMIFCSIGMVYFFSEWLESRSLSDRRGVTFFVLAALFSTMAFLVKIPTLYMGLPLFFLAYDRFEKRIFARWELWAFAILVLVPPILWYGHAYRLFEQTHLTFGIWNRYGYSKFGSLSMRVDPKFYATLAERIFGIILTPIGGVLFLVGLVLPVRSRRELVSHYWVLAIGIYMLIAAEGNRALDYYQMPLVPPAAILMSRVLSRIQTGDMVKKTRLGKVLSTRAGLGVLFLFIAFLSYTFAHESFKGRPYYAYFTEAYDIGRQVDRSVGRHDLIVTIDLDANRRAPYRSQNPALLYYCHRKGWHITPGEASPERIEALRDQGARYLVAPILEMAKNPQLWTHLKRHYRISAKNDQFMALQLF